MTVKGLERASLAAKHNHRPLDSGMKLYLMSPNMAPLLSVKPPMQTLAGEYIAQPARPGGTRETLATTAARPRHQGLALSDACFRTKAHTSMHFTAELGFGLEL